MNKHFAYLTQNDEANFFQKVANEQAESKMPSASVSIMKTAMQNLLEGVTFEKVANRLDRDIYILKTAGESGMNMGMQKRAGAYIDQLLEQCEMTPEEFDHLFEKVSSEAIMGDLVAAQAHLSQGLDDDGLSWLNGELTKIGHELTEFAIFEKEAFLGALLRGGKALFSGARAAGAVGKAAVGAKMLRAGEGLAGAARAVGRVPGAIAAKGGAAIRDFRLARGAKALERTEGAIAKNELAASKLREAGKGGGMREAFREGQAKSLRESSAKIQDKMKGVATKKMQAEGGNLVSKGSNPMGDKPNTWTTMRAKEAPKAAPKVESPSAPKPTTKPAVDAPSAAAEGAARAAKPPSAPKPAKSEAPAAPKTKEPKPDMGADEAARGGGKADEVAESQMNAAKGEGITLKGSYEKMRDQGWKALSSAEKQKLINAGVATVVGGRVVTGHGLITGGEGII